VVPPFGGALSHRIGTGQLTVVDFTLFLMRYRTAARLSHPLSEIGYGMWGMGGWTGSNDAESARALDRAVDLGCTFFDTAAAYGDGHSERLLGALLRRHQGRLFAASKVPPQNQQWPGRGTVPANDVFSYDHIVASTGATLKNLGVDTIDLQQLNEWHDNWTEADGWRQAVVDLKQAGKIRAFGISVNRWEPDSVLRALETDLIDAVQVVYNVFDQSPEDTLFPECQRRGVAVIARVPFDEGSLTGTLHAGSRWAEGDWRNIYFTPRHLAETLPRLDRLNRDAQAMGMALPELALRFILSHPAVTTTIPGMRRCRHVEANLEVSDHEALGPAAVSRLRTHRWDRLPDDRP
jgi:aryl-alcohol dehydrogenase-like predicted oxidoreductase